MEIAGVLVLKNKTTEGTNINYKTSVGCLQYNTHKKFLKLLITEYLFHKTRLNTKQ